MHYKPNVINVDFENQLCLAMLLVLTTKKQTKIMYTLKKNKNSIALNRIEYMHKFISVE